MYNHKIKFCKAFDDHNFLFFLPILSVLDTNLKYLWILVGAFPTILFKIKDIKKKKELKAFLQEENQILYFINFNEQL